jgi:hypothetical protein
MASNAAEIHSALTGNKVAAKNQLLGPRAITSRQTKGSGLRGVPICDHQGHDEVQAVSNPLQAQQRDGQEMPLPVRSNQHVFA